MQRVKLQVPRHIGIIMDGNGRWATRQNMPRLAGHKEGVEAVKRTIKASLELGVQYITFYAFSTENWKREKKEVDGIFKLLRDFFVNDADTFVKENIKFQSIGDITKLPKDLFKSVVSLQEQTKNNNKLNVIVALNYGSKNEILNAVNQIIKDKVKKVDDKIFREYLYTKNIPDPDFIIRTSGEARLSNFLLYQAAYSEFYFPKITWPEFDKKHYINAIKVYNKRDRRYGGVKQEKV